MEKNKQKDANNVCQSNLIKLQTTLIITHQSTFKPSNKSQFAHFAHPLKVLPKTDHLMEEIFDNQQLAKQLYKSVGYQLKQSLKKNDETNQSRKQIALNEKIKIQTFNEQIGILKYLMMKNYLDCFSINEKTSQKCCILYGFSLQIKSIQSFLNDKKSIYTIQNQWQLEIQVFKYSDSQFYQVYHFNQHGQSQQMLIQQNINQLQKLKAKFDQAFDCQKFTFIVSLKSKNQNVSNLKIYFFPNINATKSNQQKQMTPFFIASDNNDSKLFRQGKNHATPSQIRKSHQNFRLLQVLQHYLNLDCNSDHMIINSNQSKVIRHFLNFIYTDQIKQFYVFIDHQRKVWNKTSKSTARSICKSKEKQGKQSGTTSVSKVSKVSQVYTSDILSQLQFIDIDGQIIINDEFLSKLGQIRLPQFWLDNQEFRNMKKQMYFMKLQENTLNRQIREARGQFTDKINYLNVLIGLPKLEYDQISIDTLKTIKGAKVRQNTQELKELISISQNLKIRYQNLLKKKLKFKESKKQKDQLYVADLSELRKQILQIQKKVSISKNDLNDLYFQKQKQNQNSSSQDQSMQSSKNNINKQLLAKISKQSRSSITGGVSNLLAGRNSSSMLVSKYGPMIQQMRKKKYEEELKKLKTQAQFESEKDFQKWKGEYTIATYQLKNILEQLE